MNIESASKLSRAIAYIGYITILACGIRFELLPSGDLAYLGGLLSLSLTGLYISDIWIRRKYQIHTYLDFFPDAQGRFGWLLVGVLLLIGFFLERRVKEEEFFQPWLYATIVFLWAAAAISTLKYFRREK